MLVHKPRGEPLAVELIDWHCLKPKQNAWLNFSFATVVRVLFFFLLFWSSCKVPASCEQRSVCSFVIHWLKLMAPRPFKKKKKKAIHTGVTALCCHVGWFQTMSTDSQTAVHAEGSCQSASLFLSEASCVCMSHCYLCIMQTTCSEALWLPLRWPWLTQKPRGWRRYVWLRRKNTIRVCRAARVCSKSWTDCKCLVTSLALVLSTWHDRLLPAISLLSQFRLKTSQSKLKQFRGQRERVFWRLPMRNAVKPEQGCILQTPPS